MAGRPNTAWKATMLEKFGSEAALSQYMKQLGKKGGSAPTTKPKGFAANNELASRAGAIGGRISRRGKSKATKEASYGK